MATELTMVVNGEAVAGLVEPRTSLADFLRDELGLTGTHLGCEQGVCGACTVEIDGAPNRSCITLAHACTGASVRTIEGYDDDPVMAALRQAFADHHGLQCGYCTPGMLATCRDIVLRHESLDEPELREALSGNLCRCTGYMGIVAAVTAVRARRAELVAQLDAAPLLASPAAPAPTTSLPRFQRRAGRLESAPVQPSAAAGEDGAVIRESLVVDQPGDAVWALLSDIERATACVPGASLLSVSGDRFEARMRVSLGAISVNFQGEGDFAFDAAARSGRLAGRGRDAKGGSSASGTLEFRLTPERDGRATRIDVAISYSLAGALAQFSRGGLVRGIVSALAGVFTQNVSAMLSGREDEVAAGAEGLSGFSLLLAGLRNWLKGLFGG